MTDTTDFPTLRECVERGIDPLVILERNHTSFEMLEDIFGDIASAMPDRLRHLAERADRIADYIADAPPSATDEGNARAALLFAWESELAGDLTLVDQVVALLPPDYRLAAELTIDHAARPHPLEAIIEPDGWVCDGCGARFEGDAAVAVVIGCRPGYSDEPADRFAHCLPCVRQAVVDAEALLS